jgi:hypothetical protein
MNKLPKATSQPDGSLLVPPETKILLYRLLGDVWQTLAIDEETGANHSVELAAISELKHLLGLESRLPPLASLLGLELPPKRTRRLTVVK